MIAVVQVDFVDIPTRDAERSIAFYRDVLGLPQDPCEPTEFRAGDVTLAISDSDGNSLMLHRRYAPRGQH